MGISVKPDTPKPPHILSGDEWEQAQYAPHRAGQDPTTPMPGGRILTGDEWEQASSAGSFRSLTFPAMPKLASFAADATSRLNPNAGPADRSIPEQMGGGVRKLAAGFDAAALGMNPTDAAAAHVIAAVDRQAVAPAVEHPLLTAALANPVGAVIGTGMAVTTIAQYGWQKAHEAVMSPEDRARSEADPNRVSGEAAAVQAAMLGLGALSGVHALAKAGDVSQGVVEAGMQGVRLEASSENNRPLPRLLDSPKGAEVLGTAAAAHGLPETASPFPPATPLDAAWKEGHATVAPVAPITEPAQPSVAPATEPTATPPVQPAVSGPAYRNPVGLYKRLSTDALGTEYRALIEKRAAEQPNAEAPLWTPEREAEAVNQIENRRRTDGSLAAADKRQLDYLQAAQGEEYYVGRHTPESAAAERRVADMTKHITAIETEFQNRGLNPVDALQAPAVGGEGSIAPVEGTGDVKTRGLSLGVEQNAIAKELTDYLGDLPEYRTVNMADQATHASRLLSENPDLARRVALGEVDAPKGLLPEAVFVAAENKAVAEGDVATIRDLASSKLTEQATTMGQRIRALGERDPESPVSAIQRVAESRNAEGANTSVADAVAELKAHLDKNAGVDEDAWVRFINSIRC